jgi:hypothetical protein
MATPGRKPGKGRPRASLRTAHRFVGITCTADELAKLTAAAQQSGRGKVAWARETLLAQAEKETEMQGIKIGKHQYEVVDDGDPAGNIGICRDTDDGKFAAIQFDPPGFLQPERWWDTFEEAVNYATSDRRDCWEV